MCSGFTCQVALASASWTDGLKSPLPCFCLGFVLSSRRGDARVPRLLLRPTLAPSRVAPALFPPSCRGFRGTYELPLQSRVEPDFPFSAVAFPEPSSLLKLVLPCNARVFVHLQERLLPQRGLLFLKLPSLLIDLAIHRMMLSWNMRLVTNLMQ